jgi:hypothetical protein
MAMAQHKQWESIKVEGGQILDRVKELIHEGNVRRIRIRQGDHVVAEFPLTYGVLGAVLAPVLAAVGAIAALVKDCTIDIERTDAEESAAESPMVSAEEIVDM